MFDTQSIDRIGKAVAEYAEQDRNALDRQFGDSPPVGSTEVDDETFRAWFEDQLAQYPPMELTMPDGVKITESPWPIMLAVSDGKTGREILNRYKRIIGAK
jgi:hypothetical protein